MDKNDRIVKLEQPDGATLVIAGTEKNFRVPLRTFRAVTTELELRTSYEGGPTPFLSGKCRLEKHDRISIIGYDEADVTDLDLTIHGADMPDISETGDDGPLNACIGYTEKDVEIGNDSSFFLELRVSRPTLDHLARLVGEGALERLFIGVSSLEIYIAGLDRYAYPSTSVCWYLRPSKDSGRTDYPEMANGHLTQLVAVHAQRGPTDVLRGDADDQSERAEAQNTERIAVTKRETLRTDALVSIAKSLERLPWIIGAVLLIAILH